MSGRSKILALCRKLVVIKQISLVDADTCKKSVYCERAEQTCRLYSRKLLCIPTIKYRSRAVAIDIDNLTSKNEQFIFTHFKMGSIQVMGLKIWSLTTTIWKNLWRGNQVDCYKILREV
jgi:hypothetical protein